MSDKSNSPTLVKKIAWFIAALTFMLMSVAILMNKKSGDTPDLGAAWSSKAQPFSTVNPNSLNIITVDRPFRYLIFHLKNIVVD